MELDMTMKWLYTTRCQWQASVRRKSIICVNPFVKIAFKCHQGKVVTTKKTRHSERMLISKVARGH